MTTNSAIFPTVEATCDVVVVGGGVAGLTVALSLPPELRVVVLTKAALGESNTRYAQGGLAAPIGLDDDPELQVRDTIVAGAGLVDEAAARAMLGEAREAVAWLIAQGTRFDERDATEHDAAHDTPHEITATSTIPRLPLPVGEGQPTPAGSRLGEGSADPFYELATRYDLTLEAAHSRRRVLHAQGDATGAEIERALVAAVRARPGLVLYEHTQALDLLVEDDVCVGVDALLPTPDRRSDGVADTAVGAAIMRLLATHGVVLANGGAGRLWLRTSNPAGATADGIALALRAGATLADLEFAQFHPTVLAVAGDTGEAFLISEAVRGEGAYLRNQAGERFMPRYHPDAELAPRDVVARAVLSEMLAADAPCAYLDLRHLPADEMRRRFPSITDACRQHGLDLARDLIPIAPAAHYFMGGVAVDTWGGASVPHLYAVGEVACTGVHGANRLASNSLLEGLVFARRLARTLPPPPAPPPPGEGGSQAEILGEGLASFQANDRHHPPTPLTIPPLPSGEGPGVGAALDAIIIPTSQPGVPVAQATRQRIQRIMWERVSLRRDAAGLAAALAELRALASADSADNATRLDPETANMLLVAQAITTAALARTESRGAHYRSDYPDRDPARDGRHTLLRRAPITRDVAPADVAPDVAADTASEEATYAHAR